MWPHLYSAMLWWTSSKASQPHQWNSAPDELAPDAMLCRNSLSQSSLIEPNDENCATIGACEKESGKRSLVSSLRSAICP